MDGIKDTKISITELEKHLSDYKKRRAGNSREIAEKLPNFARRSSSTLSEIDPESGLKYDLYRSALTYSARARFTSNINDNLPHLRSINSLKVKI